jgi:tetraacyldisaccharide 4'-kinase
LLDDAMQHRSVEPGMLIMLTAYNKLFVDDCMLPGGRLREPKSSAERAHAVVVTKCPISLSIEERKVIESKVRAYTESAVFFAFELYSSIRSLESESSVIPLNDLKDYSVVLFSGLADPSNLEKWAKENTQTAEHIAFNDHHWFSENDLERIKSVFEKLNAEKRLILTTEKDAIRITKLLQNKKFADLPIYAIRHEMSFFEEDQVPFEKKINDFIGSHSTNE